MVAISYSHWIEFMAESEKDKKLTELTAKLKKLKQAQQLFQNRGMHDKATAKQYEIDAVMREIKLWVN